MAQFRIVDAKGVEQLVEARDMVSAISKIARTGKRNLFGIEYGRGGIKFLLDRGTGPLWPISAAAASVELSMGGF